MDESKKKEARGGRWVDQDVRTEMEEIDRGSEIELIDKERDRWRGRRDEKGEPWETLKDEKREFRFLQIHTSR